MSVKCRRFYEKNIYDMRADCRCAGVHRSRVKAPKEVFAPEEAFAEIPHTVSGKLIQT